MVYLKFFVKTHFIHFTYFYKYLKYRIFIALVLSFIVGIFDGFGLAMILPLLEMVDGKSEATADGLGNLSFLIESMQSIGLKIDLKTILLVMLFFFFIKGGAKFIESYYKVIVQQCFFKKLRIEHIESLSNLEFKSFSTTNSGRIQNTLSGETERVVIAYKNYFLTCQMAVMLVVYIFLATLVNAQFAILVVIGGILSNYVFHKIYVITRQVSSEITTEGHIYNGLLIQKIDFFKYLKATALNIPYANKLKATITKIENNNKCIGFYNSIIEAVREPIIFIAVVLLIFIQISLFSDGLGSIILSLLFFHRSLSYLISLQSHWNSFLAVSGSVENMVSFQKELKHEQEHFGTKEFTGFKENISIDNLCFSYDNTHFLRNISLIIPKNRMIAFIGESGSGKTTLVNLIVGLLNSTYRNIYLDGVNLTEYDIRSYRSKIGYITQEPVIFSDSIFNNVTFWAKPTHANKIKFWEALEKAAIADFIRKLPKQEDSLLGKSGINISGGQMQRLCIARELFKSIEILVLDEATSSLDSETEKIIQENIDKLKGEMTIILVAHRLSTVRNADRIILLNKGEVESSGTYSDLIKSSHRFNKMVELQVI